MLSFSCTVHPVPLLPDDDCPDRYRTVMSYSCGSSRENYFSNPDVSYLDKPTGTASADNVRVLEDNMVKYSKMKPRSQQAFVYRVLLLYRAG